MNPAVLYMKNVWNGGISACGNVSGIVDFDCPVPGAAIIRTKLQQFITVACHIVNQQPATANRFDTHVPKAAVTELIDAGDALMSVNPGKNTAFETNVFTKVGSNGTPTGTVKNIVGATILHAEIAHATHPKVVRTHWHRNPGAANGIVHLVTCGEELFETDVRAVNGVDEAIVG